ncbi:MAG: AMP-binding protein [Candidatus Hermodarchaeota archaeon]
MEVPDYIRNRYWGKYLPKGITLDLEIPEDMTLIDVFENGVKEFKDKVSFDFYGREYTFSELNLLTRRFAAGLLDLGVRKGDVIALWLPNCPQFAICYFATILIGATITAISPLFVAREFEYQVKDSDAKIVIILESFYKQYKRAEKNLALEKVIIVNVEGKVPDIPEGSRILHYNSIMNTHPTPLEDFNVDLNPRKDIAIVQYTGGTTGLPKGACLSHYNVVSMMLEIKQITDYMKENYFNGDIITLSILPWYHIYGQACELISNCYAGGKGIIMPTFDLEKIAYVIKKYRPNLVLGVPTMFINMLNSPYFEGLDISCLKYANVGAGALPAEIAKEWEKRTGFPMGEGYGLSETSTDVTTAPPWSKQKIGSCGHPVANTYVGIVSEDLKFQPIGEPGELVVSAPQVMVGYHNREEENKKVFFEAGGMRWLRTGDYAKMDEEGYIFLLDRVKDMIKYKGHSVYPREIEEILYEHPAILECAVIGVSDPIKGEEIMAHIILKPEYKDKITEEDIINWSKDNMAAYKYPRIIKFVRSLPKSAVGKILRRVIREKEQE